MNIASVDLISRPLALIGLHYIVITSSPIDPETPLLRNALSSCQLSCAAEKLKGYSTSPCVSLLQVAKFWHRAGCTDRPKTDSCGEEERSKSEAKPFRDTRRASCKRAIQGNRFSRVYGNVEHASFPLADYRSAVQSIEKVVRVTDFHRLCQRARGRLRTRTSCGPLDRFLQAIGN